MLTSEFFLKILHKEIEVATGCTDVGVAALIGAKAVEILGDVPQQIHLTFSANIYKNGINVFVPGTNLRGLAIACALGVFIGSSKAGMAVLDQVDDAILLKARKYVDENRIKVGFVNSEDPVYVNLEASTAAHTTRIEIMSHYTHFILIEKDGEVIHSAPELKKKAEGDLLLNFPVRDCIQLVLDFEDEPLAFLLEAAEMNLNAAKRDLENPGSSFGPSLARRQEVLPAPYSVMRKAASLTGAAAEARMLGVKVPIMAITGSGNHGITNFLGMAAVAEELGADRSQTIKALALASMITIYIKGFTSTLTSFCGCAIAPATGIAAGTVYLLGGNIDQMVCAMQSVVGTFAGMLCDGAKESCAYKVSTVAGSAVEFAYLAMEGTYIPAVNGIVGRSIEETFANLGRLNNPGMLTTNQVVVGLVEQSVNGRL